MRTARYVALLVIPVIAFMVVLSGCKKNEEPAPPAPSSEASRERAETLDARAKDIREETPPTIEGARTNLQQARQQFLQTAKTQIADLETRIKDLENRQVAFTGDEMTKWSETKASLNAALEKVRSEMSDLDKFSGENWQDMQTKINKSLDDLKDKYSKATDQVKDQMSAPQPVPAVPAPVTPAT